MSRSRSVLLTYSDTPAYRRVSHVNKTEGQACSPVDRDEVLEVTEAIDEVVVHKLHAERGVQGFKDARSGDKGHDDDDEVDYLPEAEYL